MPQPLCQKVLCMSVPRTNSVWISDNPYWHSSVSGKRLEGKSGVRKTYPQCRTRLGDTQTKLKYLKFPEPESLCPWLLRELADVTVRPFSISFEIRSWLGKVPGDWMRPSTSSVFKRSKEEGLENYRAVSLISAPGKVTEKILLEFMWSLKPWRSR